MSELVKDKENYLHSSGWFTHDIGNTRVYFKEINGSGASCEIDEAVSLQRILDKLDDINND